MIDWFNRAVTADEERAIAGFMERLAAAPVPASTTLGAYSALWWKAQLLRRWDDQRKAAAPLDVIEPIQVALSLIAAMLILIWALPSLGRVLSLLST